MPKLKTTCWYGGHEFSDMDYANWTRQEIAAHEQHRKVDTEPVTCRGCGAVRRLQWVQRNLGGRGSGCWQWSLIFPYHHRTKGQDNAKNERD